MGLLRRAGVELIKLITDRTQDDLVYHADLRQKIVDRTATPLEWREWLKGTKGSYNATDLNRVGFAMIEVAELVTQLMTPVSVSPKTNWTVQDIPTQAQMQHYLDDIGNIRGAIHSAVSKLPAVPDSMDSLTIEKANDIEKILLACQNIIKGIQAIFLRSNLAVSGNNYYIITGIDKSIPAGKVFLHSGNVVSGYQRYPVSI